MAAIANASEENRSFTAFVMGKNGIEDEGAAVLATSVKKTKARPH
jgi:hypothetical protein